MIALTIFLATSWGMPWVRLTVRRTLWPVAASSSPTSRFFTGTPRLIILVLQHVDQRIHPELVVRRETDLRLGPVELDGAVGAFEVVALGDLLQA